MRDSEMALCGFCGEEELLTGELGDGEIICTWCHYNIFGYYFPGKSPTLDDDERTALVVVFRI